MLVRKTQLLKMKKKIIIFIDWKKKKKVITGKGEMKDYYMNKFDSLKLK